MESYILNTHINLQIFMNQFINNLLHLPIIISKFKCSDYIYLFSTCPLRGILNPTVRYAISLLVSLSVNICVRDVFGLSVMIAHPSKLEAIGLTSIIDSIACAPFAMFNQNTFSTMLRSIGLDGAKIQTWPNYGSNN